MRIFSCIICPPVDGIIISQYSHQAEYIIDVSYWRGHESWSSPSREWCCSLLNLRFVIIGHGNDK
jgi:hypothetical protein